MKKNHSNVPMVTLALIATLSTAAPVWAQVAGGTTTVDTSATESTRITMGWSVKKTLLGKTIYNDAGDKVGKVEDMIISPDKAVSYVIVGAGGFIGIGRHDVAVPVTRIQDRDGKLVMSGATKDMIKAMPEFVYATDTNKREQFIAAADKDITNGKAKVAELEQKSSTMAPDAKAKASVQIATLQSDVKSAEAKLAEMKQANAVRWREFEAGVNTATARLRKSIETATA